MARNRTLAALRRRWPAVVVAVLIGLGIGIAAATTLPPRYESTATVFVSLFQGNSANEFNAGNTFVQGLMPSYAELATMPVVLDPVVADLGLSTTASRLAERIRVEVPPNTALLDIRATGPTGPAAAALANAVAVRLENAVVTLSPRVAGGPSAIRVVLTSPAVAPAAPSSFVATFIVLAMSALGLLVGLAVAASVEAARRPVRNRHDAAEVVDAPVLGIVRRRRPRKAQHPGSAGLGQHEAVLAATVVADSPVLLVCSPRPGDGRTSIAIDLACRLTRAGKRVLLIDADVRRPAATTRLGLSGLPGLADVLRNDVTLPAAIATLPPSPDDDGAGLLVLPAGNDLPGSEPQLGSESMKMLLEAVTAMHDVVVIDTAPLLPVAAAAALARHVRSAVLVVNTTDNRDSELREAIHRLHIARAEVVCVLLNEGRRRRWFNRKHGAVATGPVRRKPTSTPLAADAAATERNASEQTVRTTPVRPSPRRPSPFPRAELQPVSESAGNGETAASVGK